MQIIGTDPQGNVYAIEHGATRSTLYRARGASKGLHDLSEIDWKAIFTGISPIVQGIGAKIAGQPQQPYPVQPYPQQLVATAGIGGLSMTTMMLIGGGALALILILKR